MKHMKHNAPALATAMMLLGSPLNLAAEVSICVTESAWVTNESGETVQVNAPAVLDDIRISSDQGYWWQYPMVEAGPGCYVQPAATSDYAFSNDAYNLYFTGNWSDEETNNESSVLVWRVMEDGLPVNDQPHTRYWSYSGTYPFNLTDIISPVMQTGEDMGPPGFYEHLGEYDTYRVSVMRGDF